MGDTENNDTCPIKIVRHDVQINELLCFVGSKSQIMANPQISKLCCDFYDISTIQTAKDVLLRSVSLPEGDKRKSRRRSKISQTNMQDIITIFYEMKPGEHPVFVAKNLNNLPPLTMNNFDMSHIIEEMSCIKAKLKILQEAQETSLAVHAAMCNDVKSPTGANSTSGSTQTSVIATPPSSQPPCSPPDVPTPRPYSAVVRANMEHSITHDMDGSNEDILRLARIQGRYRPSGPPQLPASRQQPGSPANSMVSLSSYSSLIRRNEARSIQQRPKNNLNTIIHKRTNQRQADDVTRNRRVADNSSMPSRNAKREDVITGSGHNFNICSAKPPRKHNYRYRECVGVFVSRLHRDTRVKDVERHVLRVSGLRVKCEPIPTKYDTHMSYCIRVPEEDRNILLNSEMWPRNVIVKQYFKVIY